MAEQSAYYVLTYVRGPQLPPEVEGTLSVEEYQNLTMQSILNEMGTVFRLQIVKAA